RNLNPGRRSFHQGCERRRRMLDAADSRWVSKAALGCRPDPVGVSHTQLVGEKPEQLGRLTVQSGRQGKQIMQWRDLDEGRPWVRGLRCHRLHRFDARVVVAVSARNDANKLWIDR